MIGLDLQLPEHHPDALVRAAAERRERVTVPLVLAARLGEPVGVELQWIGPQSRAGEWFIPGYAMTFVPAGT